MRTPAWCLVAAGCLASWLAPSLPAAETAVVKGSIVNVRAQPSIFSEVLTQLKEGESVTIWEEIKLEKPKPDEPADWLRIQMPKKISVWASRFFINTNGFTVKANRLNLRAGPGENYSVVGQLERDTPISVIRLMEDWYEIETPTNAHAFIAASLVTRSGAAAPGAKPEPVREAVPAKISETTPASTTGTTAASAPAQPSTTEPVETSTAKSAIEATSPTAPTPPVITEVVTLPPPSASLPSATTPIAGRGTEAIEPDPGTAPAMASPPPLSTNVVRIVAPPVAPATPEVEEQPVPKRLVRREGTVARAANIQAPSPYELRAVGSSRIINYLMTASVDIALKQYLGYRVIVEGEEAMDSRWRYTPVLRVETIELIPHGTPK